MTPPIPASTSRRRDLLLTLVMVGILLTPAWLTPRWFSVPWQLAVFALAGPAIYLSWRHAPWVPTPRAELPRLLDALALRPTDRFCDLGAGDGRVVAWVRQATDATSVGIEASPLLALAAKIRLARVPGATVRWGDLYAADLAAFDVVYVWGTAYSVGTRHFRDFVCRSMRPGARLISYHTAVPGLEPSRVDTRGQRPIHTYVIGDA